jgi:hypothetical protein
MKNNPVIASAAKQSRILKVDCFVTLFLAMTVISFSTHACEEARQAISELEQVVAANNAVHTQNAPAAMLEAKPFPTMITTEEKLKTWAQTSTWGGGRVEMIDFAGRRLALVYRSYTSGVKSSDAAVYAATDNGWKLVKSHPPLHNTWIATEQQGDKLLFHREESTEPLMILTAEELGE